MHPALRSSNEASSLKNLPVQASVLQQPYHGAGFMSTYENKQKEILDTDSKHIALTEKIKIKTEDVRAAALARKNELTALESNLQQLSAMERQSLNIMSGIDKIVNKMNRLELALLRLVHEKEQATLVKLKVESSQRLDDHRYQKELTSQKILKNKTGDVPNVDALRRSCKGTKW
eukprot:CAMPEP_0185270220 /NCGR_PEP_ID=MMETSP1359-20130426/41765_1 /TAXON_ID=552665 /ORGANISM="Bigelowiella longifila, Strain CCMP242" /LENGTH=174 /DNA_ID=CAMNT_0027861691 /DNA_START=81 /DNA_END=602 /DNA_ORIENTATION=+